MQAMFNKSALVVFVVLSSLIFVEPGLAENTVWRIDSERSTARLFLASSRNPDDTVNVGVARANGLVNPIADDSATPDFDFTIYPADKTASLERFEQNQNNDDPGDKPDYTLIRFKSTSVVRVDKETFRVTGNLTLTYADRLVTYDPNEAYSGPVHGPAVTHSVRQQAVFEFHQVTPSGVWAEKDGDAEWSASSTITAHYFPQLLNAVSATDWPTFVADEHCVMPSAIGGEDFSGPTCTGETVETAARKDLHCEMPATLGGEDFAGAVCSPTSFPQVITDPAEIAWDARHKPNGEPDELIANQVQIQLDLKLIKMNSTVAESLGR
jgi:polyisoprenoid-binding protein YceI